MAISKTLHPERILESRVRYQDHKPGVTSCLVPNLVRGFQAIIVLIHLPKNSFGNGLEEHICNITRDISHYLG